MDIDKVNNNSSSPIDVLSSMQSSKTSKAVITQNQIIDAEEIALEQAFKILQKLDEQTNDPKADALIHKGEDGIISSFVQILVKRYPGTSKGTILNYVSQFTTIPPQIDALGTQITNIQSSINQLNQKIVTDQAAVDAATLKVNQDLAAINSVNAFYVTEVDSKVQSQQQVYQQPVIDLQNEIAAAQQLLAQELAKPPPLQDHNLILTLQSTIQTDTDQLPQVQAQVNEIITDSQMYYNNFKADVNAFGLQTAIANLNQLQQNLDIQLQQDLQNPLDTEKILHDSFKLQTVRDLLPIVTNQQGDHDLGVIVQQKLVDLGAQRAAAVAANNTALVNQLDITIGSYTRLQAQIPSLTQDPIDFLNQQIQNALVRQSIDPPGSPEFNNDNSDIIEYSSLIPVFQAKEQAQQDAATAAQATLTADQTALTAAQTTLSQDQTQQTNLQNQITPLQNQQNALIQQLQPALNYFDHLSTIEKRIFQEFFNVHVSH